MNILRTKTLKQRLIRKYSNANDLPNSIDLITIHGIHDVYYSQNRCHRLMWILLLAAAFAIAVSQCYFNIEEFVASPIVTTLQKMVRYS